MSKVREVAAIGVAIGASVVGGVAIGTAETVFNGISDDFIEDIDDLNDKQKKFLKVASRVGSTLVACTAARAFGYATGDLIRKTILKA